MGRPCPTGEFCGNTHCMTTNPRCRALNADAVETATCTNCAAVESVGFYTGCMQKDEGMPINGWVCDGEGNLKRFKTQSSACNGNEGGNR